MIESMAAPPAALTIVLPLGCQASTASSPLNARWAAMKIFPLSASSAGQPKTITRPARPRPASALAAAIPPTAAATPSRLCPHPWPHWPDLGPQSGRASYSARMPMTGLPAPAEARKAVGIFR